MLKWHNALTVAKLAAEHQMELLALKAELDDTDGKHRQELLQEKQRKAIREMVLHLPIMDELTAAHASASTANPSAAPASFAAGTTRTHGAGGDGAGDLMAHLRAVPDGLIAHKQRLLRAYAPLLAYPYPKMLHAASKARAAGGRGDAPSAARGANAVTMAVARLAADVAAEA